MQPGCELARSAGVMSIALVSLSCMRGITGFWCAGRSLCPGSVSAKNSLLNAVRQGIRKAMHPDLKNIQGHCGCKKDMRHGHKGLWFVGCL